jgi:ankyrin repeat protein
MVRRKKVTDGTTWQPILMISVFVLILFTPFSDTCATSAVNRAFLDAAFSGDTKSVKTLLTEGANVNVKDGIGFTALFGAARSGHTETVKLLLAKGADPNVELPTSGTTALMYAALNGHNDIVVALLDKGAEVNAKNKRGITSLMYAAYGGRILVAQTLLANGAEINAKDNEGLTALEYAETTHHDEVGRILKNAGAK